MVQGYGGGAPFAPLALFSTAPPQPDPRRAVLYFNCSVITSDPSNPRASAFKVRGGRFTFVGTGAETLLTSDDAPTDTVDLQGATVTPGLIDPHVHVISAGLSLSRLDLRSIKSKAEFVERVAKAAAKLTPGQWVLGANWDESAWGGEAPAASWLDAVTPHNPVFLTRSDSHQGVANSLALAAAGLGKATADVAGGVIHRDASGHPTGLLADAAMTLVTSHIPSVGKKERQAALQAAQRHALARGVTAVHDMGRVAFQEGQDAAWEDLMEVYVPAAADGTLKLRVRAFVPLTTW